MCRFGFVTLFSVRMKVINLRYHQSFMWILQWVVFVIQRRALLSTTHSFGYNVLISVQCRLTKVNLFGLVFVILFLQHDSR